MREVTLVGGGKMKLLAVLNARKAKAEVILQPIIQCDKVGGIHIVRDKHPVPHLRGVKSYRIPSYLYGFLPDILQGIARNLMMLLMTFCLIIIKKPDVVVSFDISHSPIVSLCGKLLRKPVVANIDDAPKRWDMKYPSIFRLRELLISLLKQCDAITVTGTRNKEDIIEMGLVRNKVYMYPLQIDW